MNWSNVKLIFGREVRDQLRDRRTLFMIAVLPLLLYPLLGMSVFQITQFMRERAIRVLVVGDPRITSLDELPPLFENNRFDTRWFEDPARAELLEIEFVGPRPRQGALTTAAEAAQVDRARRELQRGDCQLVLYFPNDFADELEKFGQGLRERALKGSEASPPFDLPAPPAPKILRNTATERSEVAFARVSRVLERWKAGISEQYLRDSNVPLSAARPFDVTSEDVAGAGQRHAAVWSKILPFVLFVWALTGAFYPAIDLCAGEKERGTLETLLSSPAERSEIVLGKLLTVITFSIATSALNLCSLGLTGLFLMHQINQFGGLAGGAPLSPPHWSAFVWLMLALLPVAALFSALCLALAAFARSTKEGQYYLMPVFLVMMPLMMLPLAPGVELTLGNSLIPVTGVVLLLRSLLEGNYAVSWPFIPPVVFVTLACCWLAVRWAVDQFNQESVLFRESERLDLRLWLRRLFTDRQPTPVAASAVVCFVLIMVVQYYLSMALPAPTGTAGNAVFRILLSQFGAIALPALAMTYFFTSRPRQTLLLDRFPPLMAIPAAVLLAAYLHPLMQGVGQIVQTLYPMKPEIAEEAKKALNPILETEYAWLPFVLIGLLPAICEELAFRGFILSGLRRSGHKWGAIALSAVFFGLVHNVVQQSMATCLVGLLLGYLAVQTGSLLPGMVFHATHNSLALLSSWIKIPEETYARHPGLDFLIERVVEGDKEQFVYNWPVMLAGAVLAGGVINWLQKLPYRKTSEEELEEARSHQEEIWEVTQA